MMKKILVTAFFALLSFDATAQVAPSFQSVTTGTNSSATMVVNSGASLTATGTGTISATAVNGTTVPASATVIGSNSSSALVAASTTGTGSVVLATSPTLVTPVLGAATATTINATTIPASSTLLTNGGALGTPSTGVATNLTGLPIASGVSGLGTNVATFLATPTSANLASAVTNETGTGLLVFATSPALTTPNIGAATASGLTLSGITGSTQCLHVNTSGVLSGTGSDCGSGGSTAFSGLTSGTNTTAAMVLGTGGSLAVSGTGTIGATSLAALTGLPSVATQTVLGNGSGSSTAPVALTLGGNLVATGTTLVTSQSINAQVGTSYAIVTGDTGKLLTFTNAAATAVSLSSAATTGFTQGFSFDVQNLGAGTVTITPATSTINGTSTLAIATNLGCTVTSDGTNYQVSACTAVGGGGGGSGTITAGTTGQIPVYTATTTVAGNANFTASAGALSLGVSGTAGSVKMGNATSGTLTIQPTTGALGTVTATLPANSGTVSELNLAQTWSALQTFGTNISIAGVTVTGATGTGLNVFASSPTLTTPTLGAATATTINGVTIPAVTGTADILNQAQTFTAVKTFTNSDLALLGSSTGATTFTSANASATAFTATVPANTGTIAELNLAQTFSAAQTFSVAPTFSSVSGLTQCLHVSTAGLVSGTGSDCGSGGSTAFSAITAGTNAAALVMGTGGSLATSGTGTIAATSLTTLTGMPSQVTATVVANVSGSSGSPTATSLTSFQAAMTAANAQLVTDAAPGAGPINDYAPSGYGTTTAALYITPTSGGTTLNGLVAGTAMQQVFIINAEAAGGADTIKLVNQSSSDTTAANRFLTSATTSLAIPAGGRVSCLYLAGSVNRWNCQ